MAKTLRGFGRLSRLATGPKGHARKFRILHGSRALHGDIFGETVPGDRFRAINRNATQMDRMNDLRPQ
jgi:hypothetical protein